MTRRICSCAKQAADDATKTEANSSNSTDTSLLGTASGKLDRLDNTLRPTHRLNKNMTLEEASKWLKNFDRYLNWNQPVVDKKGIKDLRDILESFLDAGLVLKLNMYESITEETVIRGPTGILETIKRYFLDNYPLINCRHDFTMCKQARGELFKTWWETKKRKAVECDLEVMKGTDWLALELIRGVIDRMLQKKLLQEQNSSLAA